MYRQSQKLRTGAFFGLAMAIGFLTFYSLPDLIPFLVRLTMMVTAQVVMGNALQREERRDER